MAQISTAQMKAALKEAAGIPAIAAEKLGCSRQNVCQRIERSQVLQDFIAEIECTLIDMANGVIVDTLGRREGIGPMRRPTKEAQATARWYVERRDRRFAAKIEASGPGGGAIPVDAEVRVTIKLVPAAPLKPEEEETP